LISLQRVDLLELFFDKISIFLEPIRASMRRIRMETNLYRVDSHDDISIL